MSCRKDAGIGWPIQAMVLTPPAAKKPRSSSGRFVLVDPAVDLGPVVAGRRGEEPHAVVDRAALRVGGAVVEPPDAGERHRRGAHGAGLERHIEIAVGQPFGAERGGGLADRDHLRMGGRVAVGERAVAGLRDHLAVADDDAADRHLARGCAARAFSSASSMNEGNVMLCPIVMAQSSCAGLVPAIHALIHREA